MSRRLRVLLVGPPRDAIGGVSTHIDTLLCSQVLKEHSELIYFAAGGYGEKDYLVRRLFRVVVNPARLAWFVIKHDPHLVHLNPSFDARAFWRDAALVVTCKLLGLPVIIQFHGGDSALFLKGTGVLGLLMRIVLENASRILIPSESQKEAILHMVTPDKVMLLPNSVDTKTYGAVDYDDSNSSLVRLLFLGRLIPEKGLYEVLDAIGAVLTSHSNVELVVAGDGPERNAVQKLCEEKGLCEHVKLLGHIEGERKSYVLTNSHIFVMPTYCSEGFPYALLEAMASGLPVVACPSGAIPEVVVDGENGFLVPPRRSDILAERISLLVRDSEQRARMGRKNRQKVECYYDTGVVLRRLQEVYGMVAASEC